MSENTERLNKYLARAGIGSRRSADDLIVAGRVLVNGQVVTRLGTTIVPGVDTVEYKGQTVQAVHVLEYLACYKPRGVVVTASDPEGRPTVYDMLFETSGNHFEHLRYVGRLDINSEGLLLLTNDGNLVHAITHPRFHVKKVYRVRCSRAVSDGETRALLAGVASEGQVLKAGQIALLSRGDKKGFWYEMSLYEGKNRQIRRMFNALGINVLRLERIQFGTVRLGGLPPRQHRNLTAHEVAGLKNLGFETGKPAGKHKHGS